MLRQSWWVLVLIGVLLAGCGDDPAPQSLEQQSQADSGQIVIPPPPAHTGSGAAGLIWTDPPQWTREEPSSAMRKAQYRIGGDAGDATLVVFYFGPGQGGDPMSNVRRWAGQFSRADGRSPLDEAEVVDLDGGLLPVTLVEITGTYQGGMGSGPQSALENYALLGAIARGPDAPWFFKLTGPEATVLAQRAAFEKLLRSLRPESMSDPDGSP